MKFKKFLNNFGNSYLKLILIFTGLVLAIFAIFFIIQFIDKQKNATSESGEKTSSPITASTSEEEKFVLPGTGDEENSASSSTEQSTETAEKYFPGDFYKNPEAPIPFSAVYDLPLNTKIDIANYYDFSRKINLDKVLPELDSSGFAIIDNPFLPAENFYEIYNALDSRQIPPLITADFLTYYYQNITKLAYKKIEGAVFYNSLWQTNKKLYETAKTRYETKAMENSLANDISLEGARRELAFLAVSLALLQPTKEQIKDNSGLDGEGKFSLSEAEEFYFSLPEYLKNDVSAELALIHVAGKEAKSPVLLYTRDYQNFIIPDEYSANERLKNFYLASHWLNSVWPLYPRGADCPDCFLDKEDWRVSFYASLLLSDDLASSQDLKNQWAQIYKIKSFFTGLRSDLTYLHYRTALDNVFGADKKATDSLTAENIDNNLTSLATEIAKIDLPLIEGGRDKNSLTEKPEIGLKILAEAQWPSEYIFNNLTATSVGAYRGGIVEAVNVATACVNKKQKIGERCVASVLDIANLTADNTFSGAYIASNTNYELYSQKITDLKKELSVFATTSWHSNNFWLALDVIKKNFSASTTILPTFARTENYRQKVLSWALSSWINFQLPPDIFIFSDKNSSRLTSVEEENKLISYGYIEPNQILAKELSANTGMMIDFLTALKISDQGGAALYVLKNLKNNLTAIEAIIKKEASGEPLSEEDYKFISNFYRDFAVSKKGSKILEIKGVSGTQRMRENLAGTKLLLVIYKRGEEKIITAGPIFNYEETRLGK
ncbi:MAG: DUF3160 domain-containing protein [Patescibacteria group bacterium]